MPNPNNFYLDRALSRVASGFNPGNYIAANVFPIVGTPKQQGQVYNIDPNNAFLIPRDNLRAPGNEPNLMDYEDPTTTSYDCVDHALVSYVPDEYRDQVDPEAEPALPNVERLVSNIQLGREKSLVTLLGTLSQTSSPSTKWDNASGTPFEDIKDIFTTVENSVGRTPNAIAMDKFVARAISESAAYRERVKYTQAPISGVYGMDSFKAGLGAILDIAPENIDVADAFENTAQKGQTKSMSRIWGENVLVYYKENPQSVNDDVSQNLGMHIVYNSEPSGVYGGFKVLRRRDDDRLSERVDVHSYYDQFLLNSGAGYLFTNVLT